MVIYLTKQKQKKNGNGKGSDAEIIPQRDTKPTFKKKWKAPNTPSIGSMVEKGEDYEKSRMSYDAAVVENLDSLKAKLGDQEGELGKIDDKISRMSKNFNIAVGSAETTKKEIKEVKDKQATIEAEFKNIYKAIGEAEKRLKELIEGLGKSVTKLGNKFNDYTAQHEDEHAGLAKSNWDAEKERYDTEMKVDDKLNSVTEQVERFTKPPSLSEAAEKSIGEVADVAAKAPPTVNVKEIDAKEIAGLMESNKNTMDEHEKTILKYEKEVGALLLLYEKSPLQKAPLIVMNGLSKYKGYDELDEGAKKNLQKIKEHIKKTRNQGARIDVLYKRMKSLLKDKELDSAGFETLNKVKLALEEKRPLEKDTVMAKVRETEKGIEKILGWQEYQLLQIDKAIEAVIKKDEEAGE